MSLPASWFINYLGISKKVLFNQRGSGAEGALHSPGWRSCGCQAADGACDGTLGRSMK